MAVQLSVAVRNAKLDAIETTISTTPVMHIRTGAQPANCATANSGTLLASLDLPSDWLAAASSGTKSLAGTWADVGVAAGTAGHFRIFASDGTTCHMQGSCSESGGGGDLILDNTDIAVDQAVTINTFVMTEGNA